MNLGRPEARMDVEVNDYPTPGANDDHIPNFFAPIVSQNSFHIPNFFAATPLLSKVVVPNLTISHRERGQ